MFEPVLTRGIGTLNLTDIRVYEEQGGYQALRKAAHDMSPTAVVNEVIESGLRGRGGAGFATGRKWTFLPDDDRPRYLVCNADESEPGTFSNRMLIEKHPHQLLEGVLLAAYAIRAARSFIYIRGEMKRGYQMLMQALEQARERGYVGSNILGSGFSQEIVVHRGAGAYICGEETALLDSLEGKRGEPWLRPPFPAGRGLYGMPTIINNVETLSSLPHVIGRGAAWYRGLGAEKSAGPKIFSVSGQVVSPGNYELPLGTTLRRVIEAAGGLLPRRRFKAAQPGGGSAPLLVEKHLDTPMDFESVAAAGSMLGTAGVIVYDDGICMVKAAQVMAAFYANESCSQCTPCRIGTQRTLDILTRMTRGRGRKEDLEALEELSWGVKMASLCGLGQTAPNLVLSALRHFRWEFEEHVRSRARSCPADVCWPRGRRPAGRQAAARGYQP